MIWALILAKVVVLDGFATKEACIDAYNQIEHDYQPIYWCVPHPHDRGVQIVSGHFQ